MKKTYLISCDLHRQFMQVRHCNNLELPDDFEDFFRSFQGTIQQIIHSDVYPTADVKLVTIESMSKDVLSLVGKKRDGRDVFVVSTCVDFAVPNRGRTLEVNRLVDGGGNIIGIGTRPGHDSLDTQCASIASLANGKPVILAEDGIFSGETVECIIEHLKKHRVKVTNVVTCFAFPKGVDRLKTILKDVDVDYVHDIEHLIDWVPDHDFFPGAPNCGRVIGVQLLDSFMPFYDKVGTSFSIPYITPFAPMNDWASIPNTVSYNLASFCLRSSVRFFEKLDAVNSRRITFGDLQGINPRVSVPVAVDSPVFPSRDTEISSYLNRILIESY